MITDSVLKKQAQIFKDYSSRSQAELFNASYKNQTSGTVSYNDGTSFSYTSVAELSAKQITQQDLYKQIIATGEDYVEMKHLYLLSIADMEINGTYFNDTFQDSNVTITRRPLTADVSFLQYLDHKIAQMEMTSDSYTSVGVIPYV